MGVSYPCKNCPDRHPGCHSTCEDYNDVKQKREKLYKEERKRKAIECYAIENAQKNKMKTMKRKQSNRCHYNCNE